MIRFTTNSNRGNTQTQQNGLCQQVKEFSRNNPLHLASPSPHDEFYQRLRVLFYTCIEDKSGATLQVTAEGYEGIRRKFHIRFNEVTKEMDLKQNGKHAPVNVFHRSTTEAYRLQILQTNTDCDEFLRFLLWTDNRVQMKTDSEENITSSLLSALSCTPTERGAVMQFAGHSIEIHGGQAHRPEGKGRHYDFWDDRGLKRRITPG